MPTEKPKFSIIIPAHNTENYISKALESVKCQVFTDYELIIVCDRCEDKTAEIARQYTDIVYEVDYGNDGLARNCGLDKAKGEYVLFMDSDDWWIHEYVLSLIYFMLTQENHPDILAFSFIWKGVGYCRNVPGKEYIAVWNKCWRREFIGNARFSDKPYGADEDFHIVMLSKAPKIVHWDMPMYYYNYGREGSLSYIEEKRKLNGQF